MSNITVSSLNARGLGNNEKRREVFQWLKKKNYSIYTLQEAHCAERSSETWAAEWGYTALFSSLASNKAGVAILLNNNFTFNILKQICDNQGRYIIIDLEVDELTLTICNIYAPNTDDPTFFQNVSEELSRFKCEEIILGGDFNLVMDVAKDKMGGKLTTHRNSLKVIQNIRDNLDLTDIWRDLNPEERRYTWRQNKPEIHCRLDFFLVSASLAGRVLKADILPGYKTDHSLCNIVINYRTHHRGPGFWKLNSSFLGEMDYVNDIKSTIAETVTQYENDETVDEVLLWEMIKLQIRDTSIKYSKAKIRKMKNKEADIESEIAALERRLESSTNNDKEALSEQLRVKKIELENIIEYKTKGAIIRSKARWYNEGEKNNKYFLNLENRHCKKKTIMQIKTSDGVTLTNDPDILKECNSFYGDLYTSKQTKITENLEKMFFGHEHPNLNEVDRDKCESLLTENECLEAVKSMESAADYCFGHQCQNNATCVNSHVNYTCTCNSWRWTGDYCERECKEALGMESGAITDGQITASSEYDNNHAAVQGRLHFKLAGIKRGAWSAGVLDDNQWLQIDLGNQHTRVTRVATQGRNGHWDRVTEYRLQYSDDELNFQYYKDQGQAIEKDFAGNTDQDTVVYHDLNPPITARYIRFRPVAWYSYISMRAEFYGCRV
ncbi:hypothetical protein ACROYT_G027586 [Oculina patagonica]